MTTDPLAWVRDALDTRRKTAEAAAERAWSPHWEYDHVVHEIRDLNNGNTLAYLSHAEIGAHVEANDPAATLRRIKAERELLDGLLAETHTVCEDPWYTCGLATEERDGGECIHETEQGRCTCGRDDRVNRRVRLLAEGYGWTEETT